MYNSHVHSVRNIKKSTNAVPCCYRVAFFFAGALWVKYARGGCYIAPPVIVSSTTYAYRCVSCVLLRLLCGEVYVDKAYAFRERCYIKRRTLHVER